MKKIIIAVLAALTLATSCNSFLDVDNIYINANYLLAPEAGGTFEAPLYATGSWTATTNTPEELKMTVTPTSGTGNTTLTITIEPLEGEYDCVLGYIVLECGQAKTSFPVYQVTDEYLKELQEGNETL